MLSGRVRREQKWSPFWREICHPLQVAGAGLDNGQHVQPSFGAPIIRDAPNPDLEEVLSEKT